MLLEAWTASDSSASEAFRQAGKAVSLLQCLDVLEPIDYERLGKARLGPFRKGGKCHHRLHIGLCHARHRNRIGAEAMHDRRIHRIRRAEGAEEVWTALA